MKKIKIRYLSQFISNHKGLLSELKDNEVYVILRELFIKDTINNIDEIDESIDISDVQNAYNDFFAQNKEELRSDYFDMYSSAKTKTKLAQKLINLSSSNRTHTDGIADYKNRNELFIFKEEGHGLKAKLNKDILPYLDIQNGTPYVEPLSELKILTQCKFNKFLDKYIIDKSCFNCGKNNEKDLTRYTLNFSNNFSIIPLDDVFICKECLYEKIRKLRYIK